MLRIMRMPVFLERDVDAIHATSCANFGFCCLEGACCKNDT
jgi:hypothetical protein